jgi:hypothetical protein
LDDSTSAQLYSSIAGRIRLSIHESPDIGDRLPERLAMGLVDDDIERELQTFGEALGRFFGGMTPRSASPRSSRGGH